MEENVSGFLRKLKTSYLTKLFGNTNKRWFIFLQSEKILAYKNERNSKEDLRGNYNLEHLIKYIDRIDTDDRKECEWMFGFQLIFINKRLVLYAETKSEFNKWEKAINSILKVNVNFNPIIPINSIKTNIQKPYLNNNGNHGQILKNDVPILHSESPIRKAETLIKINDRDKKFLINERSIVGLNHENNESPQLKPPQLNHKSKDNKIEQSKSLKVHRESDQEPTKEINSIIDKPKSMPKCEIIEYIIIPKKKPEVKYCDVVFNENLDDWNYYNENNNRPEKIENRINPALKEIIPKSSCNTETVKKSNINPNFRREIIRPENLIQQEHIDFTEYDDNEYLDSIDTLELDTTNKNVFHKDILKEINEKKLAKLKKSDKSYNKNKLIEYHYKEKDELKNIKYHNDNSFDLHITQSDKNIFLEEKSFFNLNRIKDNDKSKFDRISINESTQSIIQMKKVAKDIVISKELVGNFELISDVRREVPFENIPKFKVLENQIINNTHVPQYFKPSKERDNLENSFLSKGATGKSFKPNESLNLENNYHISLKECYNYNDSEIKSMNNSQRPNNKNLKEKENFENSISSKGATGKSFMPNESLNLENNYHISLKECYNYNDSIASLIPQNNLINHKIINNSQRLNNKNLKENDNLENSILSKGATGKSFMPNESLNLENNYHISLKECYNYNDTLKESNLIQHETSAKKLISNQHFPNNLVNIPSSKLELNSGLNNGNKKKFIKRPSSQLDKFHISESIIRIRDLDHN